jgi:hypothetical protein
MQNFNWRRWRATLIASAGGAALFGIAAVNGYAWETLWVPAAMVGAAWPADSAPRRCRARLRRGGLDRQA